MTEWRSRIVGHGEEDPKDLLANPHNFRRHPKAQQEAVAGALTELGWIDDVIVNRTTGQMIDGHLRVELALQRGDTSVPVKYVELSEPEERLALATFDPITALAEADAEVLEELLRQVETSEPSLQELLNRTAREAGLLTSRGNAVADPGAEIDKSEELRRKWGTEPGQPWSIPSAATSDRAHRLLCGDCTKRDDVARLMGDERAVLFATDPPYLVNYDGTNHPHRWNEPDKNKDWSEEYHDWDNAEQGEALYDEFVAVAVDVAIVENAAWYCWHASRNQAMLEQVWEKYGAFVHQQIVWVKDRPVLTRSWYMWQHEPCFFGWVRGKKPKRTAEDYPPTVWQIPTIAPGTSTEHPTQKPLEVFTIPMLQHTDPGDLCYEPFSGSGSQLVAAEQVGRICYALELNPAFVAVALERLAGMGLQPAILC